ncbi:MAG: FAD-binding oxidoreductase [Firmicutes bacterium]|nr:FAD-binding oxidoreductase [Bacillota bacterium]
MSNSEVRKSDVIIVGSGAVGNAAAYFLALEGLSVTVLEKDTVANGASVRNGGQNKMNTRGEPELSLGMYGVNEIWPRLMEELDIDIEYQKVGGYRNALTEDEFENMQKFYPIAKKHGMHIEYIDGKELRKRVPQFSERIIGAGYCEEDSWANPLLTTLSLYSKARSLGVRFFDHEKAVEIETVRGHAKRVITECGHIYEADKICVAACFGSRKLLNSVDLDIPFTHALCEIFVTEPVPYMLKEIFIGSKGGYYGTQTPHGSIVMGGGSRIGAFQREGNHVEYRLTPDNVPSGIKGLTELFPSLENIKIIRSWSGWHDRTPDDMCCIEGFQEVPGLYAACGFSGHGFGISAPVGKVLSELITEKKPGADISRLKFDRFIPIDAFSGDDRVR